MPNLDKTHDPSLKSWVESANESACDFPIQNLPFGIYRHNEVGMQVGVAIGDCILDVDGAIEAEVLKVPDEVSTDFCLGSLNEIMEHEPSVRRTIRLALSELLSEGNADLRDNTDLRKRLIIPISQVEMELPAWIGDYTDFYASIYHATNVGKMFRPDNPLLPNYKNLPVGYHGRAGSIVVSGTSIVRPNGQTKADDADCPTFGPCRLLDYELEMGFFIGCGNAQGKRITMSEARDHIFGMCILNDWSARDIQKWEYQPLGPFNAKNFATSISPWIVTLDALEPFRVEQLQRGDDDPKLLEYITPTENMGYDIIVEVHISSKQMRDASTEPMRISKGNFTDMYWSIAQMLVHHTSTGCNMNPGDLLASGTISGTAEDSRGCLLERTWRGQNPISLTDGTERKFLQDGDEVIIKAFCEREGAARIGFGECRGIIEPAN